MNPKLIDFHEGAILANLKSQRRRSDRPAIVGEVNLPLPVRPMSEAKKRICILGGGFGGLYTALRLSQFPWETHQTPEIVLVDRRDRFLFLPMLYELITGELQTWEIAPPFSEILAATEIRFLQAEVTQIDLEEQTVGFQDQSDLSYDTLVLALGGKTPLDIVPGAVEHAIPFRSLEDVYRLEQTLRTLEQSNRDKIRVAIAGGGYSGVELACKLGDRLQQRGRIRIIERGEQILKTSPDFNRESALAALEARQVWIDRETSLEEITADTMTLTYKGQQDTLPVDVVLWTVGTQVSELIQSLPLKHSDRARIRVEATLRTPERPEVFALGDLAECYDASGQQVPGTAQAAFQQSDYCAWNIWASLTGRPLLPFRYQHLGEMMVLGSNEATIAGMGVNLRGMFAYIARRLAYLSRMPTLEHQMNIGSHWIAQPLMETLTGVSGDRAAT